MIVSLSLCGADILHFGSAEHWGLMPLNILNHLDLTSVYSTVVAKALIAELTCVVSTYECSQLAVQACSAFAVPVGPHSCSWYCLCLV